MEDGWLIQVKIKIENKQQLEKFFKHTFITQINKNIDNNSSIILQFYKKGYNLNQNIMTRN